MQRDQNQQMECQIYYTELSEFVLYNQIDKWNVHCLSTNWFNQIYNQNPMAMLHK